MHDVSVFSAGRPGGDLDVRLPLAWARPAWSPVVAFARSGSLGWSCHVHDSDATHVLGFPWTDHVDLVLMTGTGGSLPTTDEVWEDLDQGWWGVVVPHGDLLLVAETDLDALLATTETDPALVLPGIVDVGGSG